MKKILIDATGSDNWIGGLYYKKNILFSILSNDKIMSLYQVLVITDVDVNDFDEFSDDVELIKMRRKCRRGKILFISKLKKVEYYFPYFTSYSNGENIFRLFKIKLINWIPDFQHKYFPEFFLNGEICSRDKQYEKIVNSKAPLVLSSYSSKADLKKFYGDKENVFVVPFVSYIEKNVRIIDDAYECAILEKNKLDHTKYICVMNQFWQHKNHIVILEAMEKYYKSCPNSKYKFVFTGKIEDYRAPGYIEVLKEMFEKPIIKKNSSLLGFINREEQIVIMKNAEYVIQPSLFEGWGTVVEDAKVLDKTILLSDIPVHREQKNEKCILFDPYDSEKLAKLIEAENQKEHFCDLEKGIADMRLRAKEYSRGFQALLGC